MQLDNLIHEGLCAPRSALTYHVSRRLAALFPHKALLETDDGCFGLEAFAAAGQCLLTRNPSIHSQTLTRWCGVVGAGLWKEAENAWFQVSWQGYSMDVLLMSWPTERCSASHFWVLAESEAVAEAFFLAVCEWGQEICREVLVFQGGGWERSATLYAAIQGTTFANLILPAALKKGIQAEFAQFLAARPMYERYGVPWKRGILLIGPPGNGKTHAVKALLNSTHYPCLYVKSFVSQYDTDHGNIRAVFRRARQTTPCILVLEDLDSLVNDGNRSFFLNELDGFAANTGILTIATTNHPDRLDPAILERPSRFDRKYHFPLPEPAERRAYVALWNDALEPEMRLSEAGTAQVVSLTDGFSFAYLKELFLSAMMRWMESARQGAMDTAIAAQAVTLREQMGSRQPAVVDDTVDDP